MQIDRNLHFIWIDDNSVLLVIQSIKTLPNSLQILNSRKFPIYYTST